MRRERVYLGRDELVDGQAYWLQSRNLYVGFWNAEQQGFIGIREKFGDRYLDTEYHRDDQGTATAYEAIEGLVVPAGVPNTEHLALACRKCGQPVEKVWEGKKCVGDRHVGEPCEWTEGEAYFAYYPTNWILFRLLDPYDEQEANRQRDEWQAWQDSLLDT